MLHMSDPESFCDFRTCRRLEVDGVAITPAVFTRRHSCPPAERARQVVAAAIARMPGDGVQRHRGLAEEPGDAAAARLCHELPVSDPATSQMPFQCPRRDRHPARQAVQRGTTAGLAVESGVDQMGYLVAESRRREVAFQGQGSALLNRVCVMREPISRRAGPASSAGATGSS